MNYISVTALFLFNETHDPSQAKRLERKAQFGGYGSGWLVVLPPAARRRVMSSKRRGEGKDECRISSVDGP